MNSGRRREMTVTQLINALRRMPPRARVVVSDHDHNDEAGEFNGPPTGVSMAGEALRARGYGVVIRL